MKYLVTAALAAGAILAGVGVRAEEFQWSWEKEAEGAPGGAATQAAARAEAPTDGVKPADGAKKADAAAFDALVQQNLELRRRIESLSRDEEAARRDNERLSAAVKDLEKRVVASDVRIEDLKKQKERSAGDVDRVVELEAQLAAAASEKARLGQELADSRKRLEGGGQALPAAAREAVPAGSDLFQEMRQENAQLKQKLAEIEEERQKALKDQERVASEVAVRDDTVQQQSERQRELEQELAAAKAAEEEYRQLVRRLRDQIPGMEQEVSELRSRLNERDSTLDERARDLETMQMEVERRDQRLQKAERMVALLDAARGDVRRASDRERRDMHYNMASVYARDGRYHEAEREYLRALRIDSSDADVHYNLGVLYDDKLRDDGRAAMHYRRYLRLSPGVADADQVRNWLLDLEVKVTPRTDER